MYIAVVTNKGAVAYTAAHRVARPVACRRAVARLHAVVTEVALGAKLCAVLPGVARRTAAVAVVGAAGGLGRAAARLRAVRAPPPRAARRLALSAAPTRQALTLARNMMTVGPMLAHTFLPAAFAVSAQRTRVLARQPGVPARTRVHTRYRVTRRITIRRFRTKLRAARAVSTRIAWRVAVVSGPARRTYTLAGRRVARRVVHTRTTPRAMFPVAAGRALSLTAYSSPRALTDTLPSDVVARYGVGRAVASRLAAVTEEPGRTAPAAARACVPRAAHTLTINRIAWGVVLTTTLLPTLQPESFTITRSITFQTLISRFAVTQSSLVATSGVVVAVASVGAVVPVVRVWAGLLATNAAVARRAQT